MWGCVRLLGLIRTEQTEPAMINMGRFRWGCGWGCKCSYPWWHLEPGQPWRPVEVLPAAGTGAPVQPEHQTPMPRLYPEWQRTEENKFYIVDQFIWLRWLGSNCRKFLKSSSALPALWCGGRAWAPTWAASLAEAAEAAAAAATAAAAGSPPGVVGVRRGMGGVTAFPTRRYWPPRSNRFMEATASWADWALSYSADKNHRTIIPTASKTSSVTDVLFKLWVFQAQQWPEVVLND